MTQKKIEAFSLLKADWESKFVHNSLATWEFINLRALCNVSVAFYYLKSMKTI